MNYPPPANWKAGFSGNIQPACGGTEIPIRTEFGWKLLCWDMVEHKHYWYNFSDDIFEDTI
jgi:hypothetical protein